MRRDVTATGVLWVLVPLDCSDKEVFEYDQGGVGYEAFSSRKAALEAAMMDNTNTKRGKPGTKRYYNVRRLSCSLTW